MSKKALVAMLSVGISLDISLVIWFLRKYKNKIINPGQSKRFATKIQIWPFVNPGKLGIFHGMPGENIR